jgi:hypothetical protein
MTWPSAVRSMRAPWGKGSDRNQAIVSSTARSWVIKTDRSKEVEESEPETAVRQNPDGAQDTGTDIRAAGKIAFRRISGEKLLEFGLLTSSGCSGWRPVIDIVCNSCSRCRRVRQL